MESSSPLAINTILTSDCLRLILSQFTLTEQLHLRSVCTHWSAIINQLFLSVHSLKLYGNRANLQDVICGMKHYKMKDTSSLDKLEAVHLKKTVHDFHYDEFVVKNDEGMARRACEVLPELFPNVQFLIIFCEQLFREEISEMLTQWSPNLFGLAMFKIPRNIPSTFWPTISTMTNLNRLHLVRTYENLIPHPFEVLRQLKHFIITHYLSCMVPILEQLRSVVNLKLSMVILSLAQLERAVELNPMLAVNLKFLQLGIISSPPNVNRYTNFKQVLNLFCTKFKNIIFIDILMADQLPLTEIIPILAQLPTLADLWLYIGRHQLDTNLRRLYSLPQLPSVTSLYIEIYDLTIDQFCLWIGGLFPNLKQLTVKIDPEFREKERLQERIKIEFKKLEKERFKLIDSCHGFK